MAYETEDGYGALNYLSPDYINTIAGATQETRPVWLKPLKKRWTIEKGIVRIKRERRKVSVWPSIKTR